MASKIRCPTCGVEDSIGQDGGRDVTVFIAQCQSCYEEATEDKPPDCPQCDEPMTEIRKPNGELDGFACELARCPQGRWDPEEVLRREGLEGLVQN